MRRKQYYNIRTVIVYSNITIVYDIEIIVYRNLTLNLTQCYTIQVHISIGLEYILFRLHCACVEAWSIYILLRHTQ